ncbi:TetR/AcrR family transcriptional regulator [Falsigemmobacter faecalis]|uniref:TetR/AcrR family transcriptional regulator n=1 Tax=Falsigemmobacter faecalis TaxID=2488730 RepID=UPI0013152D50|nr:TetR/AcrR family transcriptional regulator [Falsigemmobacter faecalis]
MSETSQQPDASQRASAKSDLTRQRVLDAAAQIFARRGFSGTTLSDIAKAAGLKTGSLYYHFASREDLVAEVMARGVRQVAESVEAALAALGPEARPIERLRTAVEQHLLCLLERSDYARANTKLSSEVPPHLRSLHAANEEIYGALWKDLLAQAAAAGEIRSDLSLSAVRMLMLGAMAWAPEWYRPEAGPARDLARTFSEMTFAGLLPLR